MPIRFAAALAIALALPSAAAAADAAALKVLGFSPDGRHFAFMQFGPQWEAERFQAEVFVIDADRDRFVRGVPLRSTSKMKDDTTEDNVGPQLQAFVALTEKRAAGLLGTHKISRPGTRISSFADAKAGEHSSGSEMPEQGAGAGELAARHASLGDLALKLETRTIEWPKSSRHGSHKEAASCAEEMEPEKGKVFRLVLERTGGSTVLHDDKSIPASRNCVTGYGLVEAHAFDRPDGKTTLAVVIGVLIRGFEGSDRVFLAVTRVLDR
jgi:predicted secreted protein